MYTPRGFALVAAALLSVSLVDSQTMYEIETCTRFDEDLECAQTKEVDPLPNKEKHKVLLEAWGGQENCAITGTRPEKPRSLSFCHKFNDDSCCAPALDEENNEMFDMLTGLGLSCRLRGDIRDDPLAKWYCMNCDPRQPRYLRPWHFIPVEAGGDPHPSDPRPSTLLVCADWAEDGFGTNPILAGPGGRLAECGVLKSSPCLGSDGNPLGDRDRYTCGDDLIIPSATYLAENDDGQIDAALSIEAFMNADSMGPPGLDESYGFLLVDKDDNGGGRPCTETELQDLYATINADSAQPRCLRSKAQLTETIYTFPDGQSTFRDYFCSHRSIFDSRDEDSEQDDEDCNNLDCLDSDTRAANPCCCAEWFDEVCFNSATSFTSSLVLVVVSVLLALIFN